MPIGICNPKTEFELMIWFPWPAANLAVNRYDHSSSQNSKEWSLEPKLPNVRAKSAAPVHTRHAWPVPYVRKFVLPPSMPFKYGNGTRV
jgi:hypothetical protein